MTSRPTHRRASTSCRANRFCILALALGILRASAVGGPTTEPAAPAVRFTVATYNINGGNRDLPNVAANIRKAAVDFVCLQEVNRGATGYLRERLGRQYRHIVFALNQRYDGFAFLSREPVTHRKWIPAGRINYHSFWHGRTKLGGRDVQVAAVHLIPNRPKRGATAVEQFRHLARLDAIRTRHMTAIGKHFAKDLPVIVLGDFNCLSFQGPVRFMISRGFVDAQAAAGERPGEVATWQGVFGGRRLRTRIDYVFHGPRIRTVGCRVIQQSGSDHYPVVATLTWAGTCAKRQAGRHVGATGGRPAVEGENN